MNTSHHYSPTKNGMNISQHNNNYKDFDHFQQQLRSFQKSSQMNGNMMATPVPSNQPSSSTASNWNNPQFMPNDIPSMHCLFKCSECHISKSSCEDLEVHIKVEHLNWLPFCCTIAGCNAKRASDNQIREHTYSHHKMTDHNEYRYIDNPKAKSQLQAMTDRALSAAIQQMVARRPPSINPVMGPRSLPTAVQSTATAEKKKRLHKILGSLSGHDGNATSGSNGDAINGLKAMIDSKPSGDTLPFSKMFEQSKDVENDIDPEEAGISSSLLKTLQATNDELNGGESEEADEALKSFSSLFSVDFNSLNSVINGSKPQITPYNNQHSGSSNSSTNGTRRRTVGSAANQCASKKRVLGQCSQCNKPVTAGARQMHLFFHLAKDHETFRFRCKFPDCTTEHYRKDQMENHMSKTHGQIKHELMEDRSVELYDQIQKLSMELLGTLGNKPGPTADQAQIEYNRMLQEQEESRRRKRGNNFNGNHSHEDGPISMVENNPLEAFQQIFNKNVLGIGEAVKPIIKPERHEDLLECSLCKKMIINRTRGLHILHHARNDLGLIRYQCTLCEFKHERAQSVATHGKKGHGTEECVLDTLNQYENEIKSLWKACFGHEQLFTSESKKKNKPLKSIDSIDELKDDKSIEESYQSFQSDAPSGLNLFTPTNNNANNTANNTANTTNTTHSSPAKRSQVTTPVKTTPSVPKKKASSRRFGIRKPQSKKRRAEMAKLREMSMRIGGAMYFKKKSPDAIFCEECNTYIPNRLTHHAYSHMDCDLYLCPICNMGNFSRNLVIKHLKDFHNSSQNPVDNRTKFASNIKDKIRECYPSVFIDAPVPTQAEIEQLKKTLNLTDAQLAIDGDGTHDDTNENASEHDDGETESHVSGDENEVEDDSKHEESDSETFKKLETFNDEEMAEA